ncbi:MAG TPA: haloacid dehalogenase type II [Gaiellaceae bacterium]|nr:haloacid dehalogenase type II [Gaiellaceae bacterium]
MADRFATFDCYGTLVDWETGIGRELARLWPGEDAAVLRDRYHEIEPRVQLASGRPYREVLAESLVLLAEHEGLTLPAGEDDALARSLPGWPVFSEVPGALAELRAAGWKLVPLSNTDPDLLAASMEAIGIPFDGAVVASEIGSYKPAQGHWRVFFERFGVDRGRHVHVAASLFHDIAPAQELGLTAVWINRLGETSDLPRAAELSDLSALPETLERLLPAAG